MIRAGSMAALCVTLLLSACAGPPRPVTADALQGFLDAAAPALAACDDLDGAEAFRRYRREVASLAESGGEKVLAAEIAALEPGLVLNESRRGLALHLLRRYVVGRYGERIVADLQELVRFATHAVDGQENWQAAEFVRQRRWLERRARELGLEFRSFDGRVDEVNLPGGERVLGVLTHADVQDVVGQTWEHSPWAGERVGERIYGRGTEDDKGPIVTTMYVFAALRDAAWPVGATLRLIIANGEESSWEEIPYYLERREPPAVTLGIDAAYPVTHAQKAWAVLDVTSAERPGAAAPAGWTVLSIEGGSGLSIIPERGAALLRPPAGASTALAALRRRAQTWAEDHPPARLRVEPDPRGIRVVAIGRGGHSSEPHSGHNAFGDLCAFLAQLDLAPGARNLLVSFVGTHVGTETDGASLGIAHRDEVMGELTVNLALFDEQEGRPRARINLRVPRGLEQAEIEARVEALAAEFAAARGAALQTELYMPAPPHYVPPDGPLVTRLLDVWYDVTGERGAPVAIGGGTQARLFPQGVDFGPALAMESYRGHGPDEYVTVGELHRNAELTLAALWSLAGD